MSESGSGKLGNLVPIMGKKIPSQSTEGNRLDEVESAGMGRGRMRFGPMVRHSPGESAQRIGGLHCPLGPRTACQEHD